MLRWRSVLTHIKYHSSINQFHFEHYSKLRKPFQMSEKPLPNKPLPDLDANEETTSSANADSITDGLTKNQLKKLAKQQAYDAKKAAKSESMAARQAQQQSNTGAGKGDMANEKKKILKSSKTTDDPNMQRVVTPAGEKKDFTKEEMAKSYEPSHVESSWYAWWEKCGFFNPEIQKTEFISGNDIEKKKTDDNGQTSDVKPKQFVISMPPPNVTGSLHLGHALNLSLIDILCRFNRMRGYKVLWVPGSDHAGIATQAIVEKRLAKEKGLTRHQLGREAFVAEVWKWKEIYADRIYNQIRKVGASVDWSRVAFTLDPNPVEAVQEAFIRLHREKVIYRANKLVNWSCKLSTALSNLEVDTKELSGRTMLPVPGHDPNRKYEFGVITSFKYPLKGETDKSIIVATTRIETMLGDTAIAVHPEDDRYKDLVGRFVVNPFNGREIPVIADDFVERDFGSGAVKITPAHDPNDFACGQRNNLEFINVFNDDGTINANAKAEEFIGMMRFDCRFAIIKKLKELNLFVETKDNAMALKICSRSGDIIEPLLKPQWWVNGESLAKEAMDVVRNGELKIYPPKAEKEWFHWLENIQDWCISRQLWWGHRIPAYKVITNEDKNQAATSGSSASSTSEETWVSAKNEEEAMVEALKVLPTNFDKSKIKLHRDEDVLDTWFSSGLWPFSILGWPKDDAKDFQEFYPNTILITGWDILFFWIARMVMMGLKMTGKLPFKQVLCHSMVRDAHGRKMSKSLGNVIDPIDVINGKSLQLLLEGLTIGNLDSKEIKKASDGMKEDYPKGIPECGADALRITLASYATIHSTDINLNVLRIEGYRKFGNKIWNATKFALMKLNSSRLDGSSASADPVEPFVPADDRLQYKPTTLINKWILHKFNLLIKSITALLDNRNYMAATTEIYSFWLYSLCDVYIEGSKQEFTDLQIKKETQQTLFTLLDESLKLLHPFMPFVTEELWQRLPSRKSAKESIMISKWPETADKWINGDEFDQFESLLEIIKSIRSSAVDIGAPKTYKVSIMEKSSSILKNNKEKQNLIQFLIAKDCQLEMIEDASAIEETKNDTSSSAFSKKEVGDLTIFVTKIQQ